MLIKHVVLAEQSENNYVINLEFLMITCISEVYYRTCGL